MRIVLRKASQSLLNRSSFFRSQFPREFHFPTRNASSIRVMAARAKEAQFVREDLEDLLKRRFFLSRGFDIYGGVAGLYDLGVHLSHV
jgi:hypothetical protein